MRTALLAAALLVGLAVAPAATTTTTPAAARTVAAEPVRVMFVGDSLTHGRTGSATYRYWVWRELVRQSVAARFVGPRRDLSGRQSWYERGSHGFTDQTWHAAQGGSTFADHLPLVEERVAEHRPDVIVLQLGFNDSRRSTPEQIADDTRAFLERTWAVDPTVRFVLGEIPGSGAAPGDPIGPQRRLARERRDVVTGAANALVGAEVADEERVSIAHTRTHPTRPWRPRRHTWDGVHPNTLGETLMAWRISEGLHGAGVLPEEPRIFTRGPWKPRPRVRVGTSSPGEVTFVWRREGHRITATHFRIHLRDLRTGARSSTEWYGARANLTRQLTPGRYSVRIEPRRKAMVGRPGPVTRFRVTASGRSA